MDLRNAKSGACGEWSDGAHDRSCGLRRTVGQRRRTGRVRGRLRSAMRAPRPPQAPARPGSRTPSPRDWAATGRCPTRWIQTRRRPPLGRVDRSVSPHGCGGSLRSMPGDCRCRTCLVGVLVGGESIEVGAEANCRCLRSDGLQVRRQQGRRRRRDVTPPHEAGASARHWDSGPDPDRIDDPLTTPKCVGSSSLARSSRGWA